MEAALRVFLLDYQMATHNMGTLPYEPTAVSQDVLIGHLYWAVALSVPFEVFAEQFSNSRFWLIILGAMCGSMISMRYLTTYIYIYTQRVVTTNSHTYEGLTNQKLCISTGLIFI